MSTSERLNGRIIADERRRRGASQAELAAALTGLAPAVLGCEMKVHATQIGRLELGIRPRRSVMHLLFAWSGGAITADALFGLPPDHERLDDEDQAPSKYWALHF